MPVFQTLSEDEVKARSTRGSNEELLRPYTEALRGLREGVWIRVGLDGEENQRTTKRRISLAASGLGMKLKWKRAKEDANEVVFEVKEAHPAEGAPAVDVGPDGKPVNSEKVIGTGSPKEARVS